MSRKRLRKYVLCLRRGILKYFFGIDHQRIIVAEPTSFRRHNVLRPVFRSRKLGLSFQ